MYSMQIINFSFIISHTSGTVFSLKSLGTFAKVRQISVDTFLPNGTVVRVEGTLVDF